MLWTSLKMIAARKVRLVTTSIAVMLGVAFMAGTLVLTDTMQRTFDDLYADVNAGTDVVVRGQTAFETDMAMGGSGAQRPRLDASLLDTIARIDGVAAAEGVVRGFAQIVDRHGEPIGGTAAGPPTLGGNWITNAALNPFRLTDGRAPSAGNEVVIDRGSAKRGDLHVGDTTAVLTSAGTQTVQIVGIASFGTADSPGGASFVMFTLADAERLVAQPGKVDSISVLARAGSDDDDLAGRIGLEITGTEVLTGAQLTAENQSDSKESLSFFTKFLLTFALIALFVGSFIIYNTFSILVAQRSKETAILRALGASRRQVLMSVVTEAIVVGVIASGAGLAGGIGVAAMLKSLLAGLGVDIPAGGVLVNPSTIATSLIAGVGVSLLAAILPARRAARITPLAALREVAVDVSDRSRGRLISGLATCAAGAAWLSTGLMGRGGLAAVGGGAAVAFVGLAVLGPIIARPFSRAVGAPMPKVKGVAGTLARENAIRNSKRTAATAAALMIGVALVGCMTVLAASIRISIDRSVDQQFVGDVVVDSGTMGTGGISPQLAARLAALPEVGAATGIRVAPVQIGSRVVQLIGGDASTVGGIFEFGRTEGSFDDLDAATIGISRAVADADGLTIGDTVPVTFADTGRQLLTVAVIYTERDFAGDYLVDLTAFEAHVADQFDAKVFVTAADRVSIEQAVAAITAAAEDYPQATVQDRVEFKEAQTAPVNTMLNLIYALLALAVIIALVGITNTLTLSVYERTHELGLLRAIGMSRRQLRVSVRWEALIVALLGTVTGLVIGLAFSWAVVSAMADQGVSTLSIPAGPLAVVALVAVAAGVGAAISPARRAARLDVLRAIAAD